MFIGKSWCEYMRVLVIREYGNVAFDMYEVQHFKIYLIEDERCLSFRRHRRAIYRSNNVYDYTWFVDNVGKLIICNA